MDGNVFKQMTWNRSDTGVYISNVSRFGQSAPLYIHKDGGDGLENIWAATNNGAVGLPGVSLSAEAVSGTILKACFWARARPTAADATGRPYWPTPPRRCLPPYI